MREREREEQKGERREEREERREHSFASLIFDTWSIPYLNNSHYVTNSLFVCKQTR